MKMSINLSVFPGEKQFNYVRDERVNDHENTVIRRTFQIRIMPSRNSTPRNSIVDPSKWNGGTTAVQIGKHDVQFRKDSHFLNTITDILPEDGGRRPSLPPNMKGQEDLSIHFQSKKKNLSIWDMRFPKEINLIEI